MQKHNLTEPINIEIMENEKNAHDWELNALAKGLYRWADNFNIDFFKVINDKNVSYQRMKFFFPSMIKSVMIHN